MESDSCVLGTLDHLWDCVYGVGILSVSDQILQIVGDIGQFGEVNKERVVKIDFPGTLGLVVAPDVVKGFDKSGVLVSSSD